MGSAADQTLHKTRLVNWKAAIEAIQNVTQKNKNSKKKKKTKQKTEHQ